MRCILRCVMARYAGGASYEGSLSRSVVVRYAGGASYEGDLSWSVVARYAKGDHPNCGEGVTLLPGARNSVFALSHVRWEGPTVVCIGYP